MRSLKEIANGRMAGVVRPGAPAPKKSIQQHLAENEGRGLTTVVSKSTKTVRFPTRAERDAAEKAGKA